MTQSRRCLGVIVARGSIWDRSGAASRSKGWNGGFSPPERTIMTKGNIPHGLRNAAMAASLATVAALALAAPALADESVTTTETTTHEAAAPPPASYSETRTTPTRTETADAPDV